VPAFKLKLKLKLKSWPKDINTVVGEFQFPNERNIETVGMLLQICQKINIVPNIENLFLSLYLS